MSLKNVSALVLLVGVCGASAPPHILQRQVPWPSSPESPIEVAVAVGYSTTIVLPATVAAEGLQAAAPVRDAFRPRSQGPLLTLMPQRLLEGSAVPWLRLTLVDKTQLSLRLVSQAGHVDGRVELVRSESREQARIRFLTAGLEQCQSAPASEFLVRLALQERERPDAGLRPLRLSPQPPGASLAFLRALYAEFLGRVVLLVEVRNTHPTVAWAPERAVLGLLSMAMVEAEHLEAQPALLVPGAQGWVGLAWRHPIPRTEPFHLTVSGNGNTQLAAAYNLVLEGAAP